MAFSGKKKRELLLARRKKVRQGEESKQPAAEALPRRLKTVIQREDEEAVLAGRRDATRPLQFSLAASQRLLLPWPESLTPPVSMPARPPWSYSDTTATLETREAAAFAAWDAALQAAHGGTLSRYERNLEVWRQLWRTLEVADALLLVVDLRTPLISFPEPLYAAAAALSTPTVLLLNKADLLPPSAVDGWVAYLRQRYPSLAAVVPFRADPGAAPKGFKGQRQSGFNRWRSGGDVVRNDVELLLEAVKGLPCTRNGKRLSFGDFWEGDAATAAVADEAEEEAEASDSSDGDGPTHQVLDARAQAALAQSQDWAAAHAEDSGHDGPSAAEVRDALPYVTLGVVGEPNMGKSAVINRLFGAPVVKASPTPGCTKRLQTLFLRRLVRLADCPGLIFPKVNVDFGMQLLCGNTPIAQAREPFSTIRFLAEAGVHPPLPEAYSLSLASVAEHSVSIPGAGWSPYALCEALAVKRSFLTRGGRPDVFRAANRILRDALAGKNIRLAFLPPGQPAIPWPTSEGVAPVRAIAAAVAEEEVDAEEEENEGEDDAVRCNPFAALGEE